MAKNNDILYGVFVGTKFGLTWDKTAAIEEAQKEIAASGKDGEVRAMTGPLDDYPSFDAPTFRILSDRVWPNSQPAEASFPIAINYLKKHMAKRSSQLDGIATEIQRIIEEAKTHRDTYDKNGGVVISDGYLHKINGYMEQVGIIADELKGVGK